MLSWIKCGWDQTGKQDWGNVFDIRGKPALTLFKSDCWCIKRYALGGGSSRQLKIQTQDSNMVCKAGSCLGWQLPPCTFKRLRKGPCTQKSIESTNRNSFAPANSEERSIPSSWKCSNLSVKLQWCSKAKADRLWDFHHALVGNFFQRWRTI